MKLLHELIVNGKSTTGKIQLYEGDLSELSASQQIDMLVISAFPNMYIPLPDSVIGALYKKGLSVAGISKFKEQDLRDELGCWISHELEEHHQQALHFKRLLCFEPLTKSGNAAEHVGNIFRCINNFVFDQTINNVAMPLVATGYQMFDLEAMCSALFNTAIFWLGKDLPVKSLQLVERDPARAHQIKDVLEQVEQQYLASFATEKQPIWRLHERSVILENQNKYDLFVSYSHKQKAATDHFVRELTSLNPGLKIFYDDRSIPKGAQWLKRISDAIDNSEKVIIFISPSYTQSKICWDEFQCAKIREYNSDKEILITVYLNNHESLPTILQLGNWIDCREGDEDKLSSACNEVVRFFQAAG